MKEIFVDIQGAEGIYQIGNNGSLRALAKEWRCGKNGSCLRRQEDLILKWATDDVGYKITGLYINKNHKMVSQHRLMAEYFIPNPENKREVNHKNGIKSDNRLENLEWVSSSENRQHAYATGLKKAVGGARHHASKPILVLYVNEPKTAIYPCLALCAKYLGVSEGSIRDRLKGRVKANKEYKFQYL